MTDSIRAEMLRHLDATLGLYDELSRGHGSQERTGYSTEDSLQLRAAVHAVVERVSGGDSPYMRQVQHCDKFSLSINKKVVLLRGIVRQLRIDVEAGFLNTFEELIHSAVFSDFLEAADSLNRKNQLGHKDAAAVLAGGVLEVHLRNLADKHSVELTYTKSNGAVEPKAAQQLNQDLASASAYSNRKQDQKNVTAWLNLRNDAAHAHYDRYVRDEVALMIQGIRLFMLQNPA